MWSSGSSITLSGQLVRAKNRTVLVKVLWWMFNFQQENDCKQQWFRAKHYNLLGWTSQSPDLNSNQESVPKLENLLFTDCSRSHLTELERFCYEI